MEGGRYGPVWGILLAAGLSTRMSQVKQLLPFGTSSVIGHVADVLLAARVEDLVVVLGHEHEEVARQLAGRRVLMAVNENYVHGMTTSVKCGLRAVGGEASAALLALVDQPLITPQIVNTVIEAFRAAGKGICIPSHRGRRGHPVVFDLKYRDEILSLPEGVGLSQLWRAHAEEIHHIEMDTDVILRDMNYPDEYRALLREFGSGSGGGCRP